MCPVALALLLGAAPAPSGAHAEGDAAAPAAMTHMLRYEPTGLSLLAPLIDGARCRSSSSHGLWLSPWSWGRMVEALEADPEIGGRRYQFWTFGYSTGDPIPYSAHLMRRDLDGARRAVDPGRTDVALDRMVIVGHSMGGLLAKMMAVETGDRLWRVISDRPLRRTGGRRRRPGPLPWRPVLRAAAGGPSGHLRRHAAPGQSIRPGGGREDRHEACPRTRPPPGRPHDRLVSRNPPGYFRDDFPQRLAEQHRRARMGLPDAYRPLGPGDSAVRRSPLDRRGAARRTPRTENRRPGELRQRPYRRRPLREGRLGRAPLPGSPGGHRRGSANPPRAQGTLITTSPGGP